MKNIKRAILIVLFPVFLYLMIVMIEYVMPFAGVAIALVDTRVAENSAQEEPQIFEIKNSSSYPYEENYIILNYPKDLTELKKLIEEFDKENPIVKENTTQGNASYVCRRFFRSSYRLPIDWNSPESLEETFVYHNKPDFIAEVYYVFGASNEEKEYIVMTKPYFYPEDELYILEERVYQGDILLKHSFWNEKRVEEYEVGYSFNGNEYEKVGDYFIEWLPVGEVSSSKVNATKVFQTDAGETKQDVMAFLYNFDSEKLFLQIDGALYENATYDFPQTKGLDFNPGKMEYLVLIDKNGRFNIDTKEVVENITGILEASTSTGAHIDDYSHLASVYTKYENYDMAICRIGDIYEYNNRLYFQEFYNGLPNRMAVFEVTNEFAEYFDE